MIDPIRHLEVFSPESFGDREIHLIGVGATGSRIALGLAKLGITNIHLWDYDHVEAHNIANQAFGNIHIGMLKVDALQQIIFDQTGVLVNKHPYRVDGTQDITGVVFLLTDTMASRQEIWKAGIRYKSQVELMIETRMGSNSGRIYALTPTQPMSVKGWEATLYGDDVAEVSACGASITVGSTAEIVSGLAVWQLIRWHQVQLAIGSGKIPSDEFENEVIFSLQPMMIATSNFS